MTRNPFVNALAAAGYISLIAMFFSYLSNAPAFSDQMLGLLAPVFALSLFVFSAALMGYFFLSEPLQLLIGGQKAEAAKLFLATAFSFAAIIAAIFLTWFLLSSVL